ncbi:ArsR/SmtB family transcription factor [Lewinella sp. IMCC34183]|uniref:ArsR/SmtB family transcription factor n=1 Tax=Lewinella sp. IMCC34183 TaxID=2248762 RepID=UPI000E27716B|nr:metalloregulator ArsR/SmtB family transcription factor [Lewinella sp. IMCC34183]
MDKQPNPSSSEEPGKQNLVDPASLSEAALILRALNHELRQEIINLLCGNKQLTVTDIFIALRVEQSVASQHLAILRKANLVLRERQGKYIHYSINADRLSSISKLVHDLAFNC